MLGFRYMTKERPCPERTRLAEALERAAEATILANANLLTAQKQKREAASHAVELLRTRSAEFAALSALEQHRIVHGC